MPDKPLTDEDVVQMAETKWAREGQQLRQFT